MRDSTEAAFFEVSLRSDSACCREVCAVWSSSSASSRSARAFSRSEWTWDLEAVIFSRLIFVSEICWLQDWISEWRDFMRRCVVSMRWEAVEDSDWSEEILLSIREISEVVLRRVSS